MWQLVEWKSFLRWPLRWFADLCQPHVVYQFLDHKQNCRKKTEKWLACVIYTMIWTCYFSGHFNDKPEQADCPWIFSPLLCFVDVHLLVLLYWYGVACRSEVWQQCCCDGYIHQVLKSFGHSFLQNHKLNWKRELSSAYRVNQMRHFGKRSVNVERSLHATCSVSTDEQLLLILNVTDTNLCTLRLIQHHCSVSFLLCSLSVYCQLVVIFYL